MFIKISTQEFPRFEGDVRLDHPEIGADFVCPDTYSEVLLDPEPAFDYATQKLEYSTPRCEGGIWRVGFEVVNLTAEEIEMRKPKAPPPQLPGVSQ